MEIEWEPQGKSGSQAEPEWRIVGSGLFQAGVLVLHPIFADVTSAAFGQDPSYATHLLRDTSYWRAVLDEASGIDIFGNYGISVGDADGDGRDEIYVCQPQGLPNRLYRQSKPGVFEDIAPQAGVDLLDATAMALFADLLNQGRQDLDLDHPVRALALPQRRARKIHLAHQGFPPSAEQAALTAAALGDYDRDGFLDLYAARTATSRARERCPYPPLITTRRTALPITSTETAATAPLWT